MAIQPRWLRGAGPKARYVGFGAKPAQLFRYIDDLPGWRGVAERVALALAGARGEPVTNHVDVIDAIQRLKSLFPSAASGLMIYTGSYKDTILAGVILDREPLFVKVFRTPSDADREGARITLLLSVVPSTVEIARPMRLDAGVVAYTLLSRDRRRPALHRLEGVALSLGISAMPHRRLAAPSWAERATAAADLLKKYGTPLSPAQVNQLSCLDTSVCPAHGDFTPWNAFLTAQGRVGLVDYERVAYRAPFTDIWHLHVQLAALRGRTPPLDTLLARVATHSGCRTCQVREWLVGYLIDELLIDCSDWVCHERRHPQLRRLIALKKSLLATYLSHAVADV
jgi:hypothetical protein